MTFYSGDPVWIPLIGGDGPDRKRPAVRGWQSPEYKGATDKELTGGDWFGLRCDGLVVIDCDTEEAARAWITRCQKADASAGFIRKTPRGFHFIYLATKPEDPTGPAVAVFDGTDVRAGSASYIVYRGDGYYNHTTETPVPFPTALLPTKRSAVSEGEEWSEMPEGRGNNTMTAIAGAMRRQGMNRQTILKVLLVINKLTMTQDPMPSEDVALIASSVCRYKPDPDIDLELG